MSGTAVVIHRYCSSRLSIFCDALGMMSHSARFSNGLEERVYFEQNKHSETFGRAKIETLENRLKEKNGSFYKPYNNLSTDDYDWTNRPHALSNPPGPVIIPNVFPSTNPLFVDPNSYRVVSNKPSAVFENNIIEIRTKIHAFREKQKKIENKKPPAFSYHRPSSATDNVTAPQLHSIDKLTSLKFSPNLDVQCSTSGTVQASISKSHCAVANDNSDLIGNNDGVASVHYADKSSADKAMTVDELLAMIQMKKDIPKEKYYQLTADKKVTLTAISDQICEKNRQFIPKIVELAKKPSGPFVINEPKSSEPLQKKLMVNTNINAPTLLSQQDHIVTVTPSNQTAVAPPTSAVYRDIVEKQGDLISSSNRLQLKSARKSSVNPHSGEVGNITAIAARPFSAKNVELNKEVGRSQRMLASALQHCKARDNSGMINMSDLTDEFSMPMVDDEALARLKRSADQLDHLARPPVVFTLSPEGMLSNVHFRSLEPIKRRGSKDIVRPNVLDAPSSHNETSLRRIESPASISSSLQSFSSPNRTIKSKDMRSFGEPLRLASVETQLAEKYALMTIFENCGGSRWLRADNWGTAAPLREWYGVGVNMEGYVLEVDLSRNNLTGDFPDSLHGLSKLEVIIMDGNELKGELPEFSLCKVLNLQVLSVRNNKLHGDIPFFGLSDLENLRELWLSGNKFTGPIPGHIDKLRRLTHFCVSGNLLTGSIPNEICTLRELLYLSIGNNRLSGILPPRIIELDKLKILSVYGNQLTGQIPNWLETLPDLRILELFSNNFDGYVPQSLEDLRRDVLALKQKFNTTFAQRNETAVQAANSV